MFLGVLIGVIPGKGWVVESEAIRQPGIGVLWVIGPSVSWLSSGTSKGGRCHSYAYKTRKNKIGVICYPGVG